ncbi:MAG: hypothetical protein V1862_09795 [Methanobacteriota archaeon]
MPASAQTKKGRFRIGIVGFMSAAGNAIHLDTPTGKYVLPAYKWARLLNGQRSVFGWILDLDCSFDGSCSICFTIEKDLIKVEDQEQHEDYFVRVEDMRNLAPGQMIPVYGTSSPVWKYRKSGIAGMIQNLTRMTAPAEAI